MKSVELLEKQWLLMMISTKIVKTNKGHHAN